MKLTEDERQFLLKRKRLTSTWTYVGIILIFSVFGFGLWLYLQNPLLINPFEAASRIEAGTMKDSTLNLMAVIMPVIFFTCLLLLIIIILFTFSAFSNEKRYLKIIESLLQEGQERHLLERGYKDEESR